MNCLFCKIASQEIKSEVIYEDAATLAFLDINPCAPGHTVVIPKMHAENIIDLRDELIGSLFLAVKNVVALLKEKLSGDGFTPPPSGKVGGFTIGINQGSIAGQAINHLHIHVIPRYEGDKGGSLHSVVQFAGQESVGEIAKRITNN